jgi:hypothetical protein
MDILRPISRFDKPDPAISCPSVNIIPTTPYQAYCIGLDVGRRREDPVFTCFAALTNWGGRGRDDLALAELITSFHTGWHTGSSEWFDTEGGDR